MTTKPLDWISFEAVYEPDPEAEVAALVAIVEYSREHNLAERYPTSEHVVKAVTEREAHFRACNVCFLESEHDACPEGLRLAAVADRAMNDTTATQEPADGARPESVR